MATREAEISIWRQPKMIAKKAVFPVATVLGMFGVTAGVIGAADAVFYTNPNKEKTGMELKGLLPELAKSDPQAQPKIERNANFYNELERRQFADHALIVSAAASVGLSVGISAGSVIGRENKRDKG